MTPLGGNETASQDIVIVRFLVFCPFIVRVSGAKICVILITEDNEPYPYELIARNA